MHFVAVRFGQCISYTQYKKNTILMTVPRKGLFSAMLHTVKIIMVKTPTGRKASHKALYIGVACRQRTRTGISEL